MGMKLDGLANFGKALVALQADIPEIMDKLVVGEGRFARDQARKICTEENIINTGDYRRNFNSSSKAIRIGTAYKIDVFNNLDYAKPLEYGFRGHFVPGHWDGKSFVYQESGNGRTFPDSWSLHPGTGRQRHEAHPERAPSAPLRTGTEEAWLHEVFQIERRPGDEPLGVFYFFRTSRV